MKYLEQLAWMTCTAPGCDAGRAVDSRHVDNIISTGGWECTDHEAGHQTEVPC
jgi:hypothetical protein